MLSDNDSSQASVKAMLTSNNVNMGSLRILKHTHHLRDLINNHTDIMSAYISKFPFILEQKKYSF